MRFRPCIDIHNGMVKQIVGSSLRDEGSQAFENYVSGQDAAFYADMYHDLGLSGGHAIILNQAGSKEYKASFDQMLKALGRHPGELQAGGGITADNATDFLAAGASHVIVTSYVFSDGIINYDNLKRLEKAVGKKHIVLDLSCRKTKQGYMVVTDRWQHLTNVELSIDTLKMLSGYCDEFLVHAADVEGRQNGIEEAVAGILGEMKDKPVTYAGGVHCLDDIRLLKKLGAGHVDVTVGSALKIFGGDMEIEDINRAVGADLQ